MLLSEFPNMYPKLTLPTSKYHQTYLEALAEFPQEHLLEFEYAPLEEIQRDFNVAKKRFWIDL